MKRLIACHSQRMRIGVGWGYSGPYLKSQKLVAINILFTQKMGTCISIYVQMNVDKSTGSYLNCRRITANILTDGIIRNTPFYKILNEEKKEFV